MNGAASGQPVAAIVSASQRRFLPVRRPRLATSIFPGDLGHPPGLVDAPGERLFAVDVLAQFHGRQADRGVHVVGDAHDHRVDLPVYGVEQLALVAEPLGPRELPEGFSPAFVVHVAESDDILSRDLLEVLGPLAATANDGDVQLLVRAARPSGDVNAIQTKACKPRPT